MVKKIKQILKIKKKNESLYELSFPHHKLLLIGTVHVSPESVKLVKESILKYKPNHVFIELDSERKKNILQKFKEINILKIIKTKRTLFFLSYLFLSILQKKISEKTGSSPGEEFKQAIRYTRKVKAQEHLIDRNSNITLKRISRSLGIIEKVKILYFFFSFEKATVNQDDGINYKQIIKKNWINKIINELDMKFRTIKKILIDERDIFMAKKILTTIKKNKKKSLSVVVVGAGHLPGMIKLFKREKFLENYPLNKLEIIPPRSFFSKIFPFLGIGIILVIFTLGFFFSENENIIYDSFNIWFLTNGFFCALGSLIALANPITIFISFLAAPITSLNPTIGAGMITALVQTILVPPKVKDFEGFSLKITDFKYWWKNRLTKILLVFIFSSIGSAIGTLVALSIIINQF